MKRILITGSNGLLGQKLVELFARSKAFQLILTSKQEESVFDDTEQFVYRRMDTTNKKEVRTVLDELEPEIIINSAAITNVDKCETERALAWQTNVGSVENLIQAGKLVGAKIIQVSTDYVFDGKAGPYDEHERVNPISYYGKSKLAAENLLRTSGMQHAIARTMILYGVGLNVKKNFAIWVHDSLEAKQPIKVVDDQISNPTLADDVAYAILRMIELERDGLYHISGPTLVSRYEFALKLAETFDFDKKLITPVKTITLKQPAPRPLKSGFITLKAETELGFKGATVEQGLQVFKNQLNYFKSLAKE